MIDRPTPPHIKSKTTKKIEHNFGSGNQKICSDETDERLVEKIEGGTKRLVDNLSLSTRFKHLIKGGIDNVGKDNRLSIATKHPSKRIEDSQSSNDDRHWKRPKKPNKQSIDDEESPIRVPDAAQFFDVPSPMVSFRLPFHLFIYCIFSPLLLLFLVVNIILQSSLGDHDLHIEDTLESMPNLEDCNIVLSYNGNSKEPIGANIVSACPPVIKGPPQKVEGTEPITVSEISHFCADSLISDLRRQAAITLWENLR